MIQADEDGKGQVKAELEKDMLEDRGGKEQGPIIKTQKFFLTQTFLDPTFFQDSRFFQTPKFSESKFSSLLDSLVFTLGPNLVHRFN